jgi:hypothetical protein
MMGALVSLYYAKRAARAKPAPEIEDEEFADIEIEATPVGVSAVRAQR